MFSQLVIKSMDSLQPAHYKQGSVECIDAMIAAFGRTEVAIFCRINAMKYMWRSTHHPAGIEENIQKSAWFLNKCLELTQNE